MDLGEEGVANIVLSRIEKSFSEEKVLKGIDLEVMDGEFLTLVGPSGCGKSTLLRIIAGLETQDSGSVRIGERLVDGVRASDRDLAMVFQSYALYPHLSVRENMMTPLRLRDLSVAQRLPMVGRFMPGAAEKLHLMSQAVAETAEVLKIEPLLARKPGQLSGGQRQRAALGRAMVRRPVAFLMDEPLSNLDAALRVHMRTELSDLHRRLDSTFIYVTHDQAEALTMSTRMAVMMGGEVLQLDTPSRIYADPANRRVAEFVGSPKINLLSGELDNSGRVTLFGKSLQRRVLASPQEIAVGLRPEHLTISDIAEGDEIVTAQVRHFENLGSDIYLHLSVNDGHETLTVRSNPESAAHLSFGDQVRVAQTRGAAMVFGRDGARLRFEETLDLAREVA